MHLTMGKEGCDGNPASLRQLRAPPAQFSQQCHSSSEGSFGIPKEHREDRAENPELRSRDGEGCGTMLWIVRCLVYRHPVARCCLDEAELASVRSIGRTALVRGGTSGDNADGIS